MSLELFPYQKTGSEWLTTKNLALLADEMGLGKSAQAITAADAISAKRVLVLCPAVARDNWYREIKKFSSKGRHFEIVYNKQFKIKDTDSVICSYDLAPYINVYLETERQNFDVLILDESQYLKSPTTVRSQMVFGKTGLCRKTKRIWALSGTPAPNNVSELWPIFFTFGVTTLDYEAFVKKYCTYIQRSYRLQITGTKQETIPEIRKLLEKIMLRRRKDEVMKDLPPIFYNQIYVEANEVDLELTPSFFKYQEPFSEKNALKEKLEVQESAITTLIRASELQQTGELQTAIAGVQKTLEAMAGSVATLRRYTGCQKVKGIAELLAFELENKLYNKIVIFAIHTDVIEYLRNALNKDFRATTLFGGTPPEKRQRHIDSFKHDPNHRVFIGNIQACGTAIDLTAANQVLFAEMSYVPGENAQAIHRCHRYPQKNPVMVRFVSLANSYDDRVTDICLKKTRELTRVFDAQ